MNKKELKVVIKEMVRESLMEIFAEMHLENIVEKVIKTQAPQLNETRSLIESFSPSPRRTVNDKIVVQDPTKKKEQAKKNLNVSEQEWKSIYETIDPNNSVLQEATEPEFVPEDVLAKTGLMKDYSKFLK